MSNDKSAYGWSGHLLISDAEHDKEKAHRREGVVVIPDLAFLSLVRAMENCKLDGRINVERLGVVTSEYYFLAAGHPATFSEGYQYYGTVFTNAEDRVEGGNAVDPKARDAEYMAAMKEIYALDLPPCRLMVGCSVEH
jgi:hypothetical protein